LWSLLSDRQCRQKYGHQPVLSPGQAVTWMTGDLKNKLAVSAFVEEATGRRTFYWKSAGDKWPR
jgi:hypothetical protein